MHASIRRVLLLALGVMAGAWLSGCGGAASGDPGEGGATSRSPMDGEAAQEDDDGDGEGGGDEVDPRASERLVIRFADGEFELLSRIPIEKLLPPSDELPETDRPLSGFRYELQTADGEVLYRRFMTNPVPLVFEGPEPDSQDPFPSRVEAIPEERVFTLLIPAPRDGERLVLYSSPLEVGAQAEPASEVAAFTFEPVVK